MLGAGRGTGKADCSGLRPGVDGRTGGPGVAGVVPLGTEGGVPQRLGRAPGSRGTKGTRLCLPRPGEEAGGPESTGDGDEGPREARAGKAQGKSDLSWANSARTPAGHPDNWPRGPGAPEPALAPAANEDRK